MAVAKARCRQRAAVVRQVTAAALAALGAIGGCAPGEPPETAVPREPSPVVERVGLIAAEEIHATNRTCRLSDGRVWEAQNGTFRILVDSGGGRRLLIAGRDATGTWLAVLGHQDGVPDDCFVSNQRGREWPDAIGLLGFAWPKRGGFQAGGLKVATGFRYPDGTRFCFDEHGQVARAIAP